MGRPRKNKVAESDFIEEAQADEVEDELQLPIATQRHRVVTEFTKHVPVAEVENADEPYDPPAEPPPQQPDPIEQFLAGMGGSSARWEMVIYRLPKYASDGRTDQSSRERCGRLDFTEEYEAEIQKRWARASKSNHFLVVVKKNGMYFKQLPVFSCEPPLPEEMITTQQVAPVSPPIMTLPYHDAPEPQQPVAVPDPMKQLKQLLEMQKLMREALGDNQQQSRPAQAAAPDPETSFLQVLAQNTNIVEKLANGALGKLLGDKANDAERDPWADVAMEAIKSGQAADLLRVGIESLFNGVSGLFPKGQNDGQPQIPQTQVPPQTMPASGRQISPRASAQTQPQSEENIPARINGGMGQANSQQPPPTPEEQVLALTLEHCERRIPPQIALNRILAIAEQLNDEAPAYSIDGYLQLFAQMTPEAALEVAKTITPDGERIAALPHAQQWTAELQSLLKEPEEEHGDDID